MAQAEVSQAATQKTIRRTRLEIKREMKALSAVALFFLIPGFITVFMMPSLGVILMAVGGFIWIQKDAHYMNELQRNGFTFTE